MSKGSARRPAAERELYQNRYAKIDWCDSRDGEKKQNPPGGQEAKDGEKAEE